MEERKPNYYNQNTKERHKQENFLSDTFGFVE